MTFPLIAFACLAYIFLASPVFGQYREFKNKDGRSITAIPLSKKTDSLKIRVKGDKEYTVPLVSLSDEDQKYFTDWEPPEVTIKVVAFKGQPTDPLRDYYFTLKGKEGYIEFSPFQQREVINALEEFIRICEDMNVADNPDYLKSEIPSLNGRYEGSNSEWHLILRPNKFQLYTEGPGRFGDHMVGVNCSAYLDIAPYLLNFLRNYDAEDVARQQIEIAKKISR